MTLLANDPLSPAGTSPEALIEALLAGETLLAESPNHVLQVVGVLQSYGDVLDAYSNNLIYQGEHQFLNLFPIYRYLDGRVTPGRLWKHLIHDRINFEYAEYCQKAMLWHGTGGLDAYLDSAAFLTTCERVIALKRRRDPILALLHPLFPEFIVEQIRSITTIHALGQFWRVMSDLFLDLAAAWRRGQVGSIAAVVAFIRDGLVAAAANPITYSVEVGGETIRILPPEARLTFLADVAVPYVEAVFLRGMPFLGTVSFNAQAWAIPHDQEQFRYGALFADPLPVMGAGIPPSLLMQDMFRHLPEELHDWYRSQGRGDGDVHVKICMSFQKSMFCVTNAAIAGTFPHPLDSSDPGQAEANRAYAEAWVGRLMGARLDALPACGG